MAQHRSLTSRENRGDPLAFPREALVARRVNPAIKGWSRPAFTRLSTPELVTPTIASCALVITPYWRPAIAAIRASTGGGRRFSRIAKGS
jgi:hypothetical protein